MRLLLISWARASTSGTDESGAQALRAAVSKTTDADSRIHIFGERAIDTIKRITIVLWPHPLGCLPRGLQGPRVLSRKYVVGNTLGKAVESWTALRRPLIPAFWRPPLHSSSDREGSFTLSPALSLQKRGDGTGYLRTPNGCAEAFGTRAAAPMTDRLPTGSVERTAMGRWGSGRCTHFRCPGRRNHRWRECTGRPRP